MKKYWIEDKFQKVKLNLTEFPCLSMKITLGYKRSKISFSLLV